MNFYPCAYAPGEIHDPWNTSLIPKVTFTFQFTLTGQTIYLMLSLSIKSYWKVNRISISLLSFSLLLPINRCYICLVEYEEGDSVRVLPCHHEFHRSCIDKWLKEIHRYAYQSYLYHVLHNNRLPCYYMLMDLKVHNHLIVFYNCWKEIGF